MVEIIFSALEARAPRSLPCHSAESDTVWGQDTVLNTRSQSVGLGMEKGGEAQRGVLSERTVWLKKEKLDGRSWRKVQTPLLARIPRSQF